MRVHHQGVTPLHASRFNLSYTRVTRQDKTTDHFERDTAWNLRS